MTIYKEIVSIIMPMHNSEKYMRETIGTICIMEGQNSHNIFDKTTL